MQYVIFVVHCAAIDAMYQNYWVITDTRTYSRFKRSHFGIWINLWKLTAKKWGSVPQSDWASPIEYIFLHSFYLLLDWRESDEDGVLVWARTISNARTIFSVHNDISHITILNQNFDSNFDSCFTSTPKRIFKPASHENKYARRQRRWQSNKWYLRAVCALDENLIQNYYLLLFSNSSCSTSFNSARTMRTKPEQ